MAIHNASLTCERQTQSDACDSLLDHTQSALRAPVSFTSTAASEHHALMDDVTDASRTYDPARADSNQHEYRSLKTRVAFI